MTVQPAGFPGPDRPVPYSLTAKAEAELGSREPESGCLLPVPALQALAEWTPGTSARLLAELRDLEAPEPEIEL
jgi:hypothetical protein